MILTTEDLPAATQTHEPQTLHTWVAGANARALRLAPCLADADADTVAEAKLILIGAVQRWSQAGAGSYSQTQQTAGPFVLDQTYDTRQRTGFTFWPSEVAQLQGLCRSQDHGKAFSVDTLPTWQAPTSHPFLTDTERWWR
ncbi:hypothetical protein CGZ94_20690 [Enemella evansiae]|uniref:Head-to-tail adaptor n=1 Tax=Enemella evansiae TaxID=2016499 RepID=A0A255FW23_9ACTN|nr:hypothetical protein [Enemella evansiae]OYO07889.1 hypothetical protein CGZ94_20690 [Enemella evansiae]